MFFDSHLFVIIFGKQFLCYNVLVQDGCSDCNISRGCGREKKFVLTIIFGSFVMCDTMTAKSNVSCNLFSLPFINIQSMHFFFWGELQVVEHEDWKLMAPYLERIYAIPYIYMYIFTDTQTHQTYIYIYGLDVFVLLGTQFLCLPEVV